MRISKMKEKKSKTQQAAIEMKTTENTTVHVSTWATIAMSPTPYSAALRALHLFWTLLLFLLMLLLFLL